jgi:hypothetical protein
MKSRPSQRPWSDIYTTSFASPGLRNDQQSSESQERVRCIVNGLVSDIVSGMVIETIGLLHKVHGTIRWITNHDTGFDASLMSSSATSSTRHSLCSSCKRLRHGRGPRLVARSSSNHNYTIITVCFACERRCIRVKFSLRGLCPMVVSRGGRQTGVTPITSSDSKLHCPHQIWELKSQDQNVGIVNTVIFGGRFLTCEFAVVESLSSVSGLQTAHFASSR